METAAKDAMISVELSYLSRQIAPSALVFGNPTDDAGYAMALDTLQ